MIINIHTDGGARGNPGPAAGAFIAKTSEGKLLQREGKFLGERTNNEAEYEALTMALAWASDKALSQADSINFYLDSELVVRQVTGVYKVKSKNILPLVGRIKVLEKNFKAKLNYFSVPRIKNKEADLLVNKVLDSRS